MSRGGDAGGANGVVYDPVSRGMHWLNAILALLTVLLAWSIQGAPRHSNTRELLITLHSSFGIVILALMLFWAAWRLRHRSPALRPVLTWLEVLLARATQAALFLLFMAMPVTGYVSIAAVGKPVSLFGVTAIPPLAPLSGRLSQIAFGLHLGGEFLIYGLVALHVSAALMHGFIRRDGILQRMLPGRS